MNRLHLVRSKLSLKGLLGPLLTLSLVLGVVGLFGGSVSAVSVGLIHASGPNDGDTTSTSVGGNANTNILNTWQLDASTFPSACTLSDVRSMTVISNYSKSQSPSPEINPYQDGGFIFIGESSGGPIAPWGTISSPSGDIMGAPYTGGISRDYTIWGGAAVTTVPMSIGGAWSSSVAPTANFVIAVMTDSTNTGSDHNISGATVTISKPVVDIDFSSCAPTNTTPTITSPSATTIPSTTTSGSTVVPGSSLAAADTDGDTLSYSITAGNPNSYFAIDSNTGNITTTQTNIPAGIYTITVQVDDGKGGTATADVTITVTSDNTVNIVSTTNTGGEAKYSGLASTGLNLKALTVITGIALATLAYFRVKVRVRG
jgi:hypothetical protein